MTELTQFKEENNK